MNHLGSIWQKVKRLAPVAAVWLAMAATALAAEPAEEEQGASWVPSYGLVLLGIVLGLLGVCLSSRRRERAKPEAYAQSKLGQSDKG